MAENLSPSTGASEAGPSQSSADWPAQLTDAFVGLVGQVRSKTTRPAIIAARAVVFGLVVAMLGIAVVVLTLIGVFRAADQLRNLVVADSVWLTYLVLGALLLGTGVAVFSRRKRRD